MTFSTKNISYQITLESGGSVNLTGLRSSCLIYYAGGIVRGTAVAAIYGMTLSEMNKLTGIGPTAYKVLKNKIIISAGEGGQLSQAYEGTLTYAYADMQAQPEVCFRLEAQVGAFEAVMPSKVTSVQGNGDAATIAGQIAQKMGFKLEDNGVKTKLSNPYLSGSYLTQFKELAEHSGYNWVLERGIAAIVPPGKARQGDSTIVSDKTGMVGYPAYTQSGIIVSMLFRPAVTMLSTITVQSQLTPACGRWDVTGLTHDLEALTPHGRWFTIVQCVLNGTKQLPGDQQ